jgi:hypothetical protein
MNKLKNIGFPLLKSLFADKKTCENTDILGSLEKIVEISKKHGVDKCLSIGKAHLDYVSEKLDISPLQAVLFSHFMEHSAASQIKLSVISDSLKCSKIRVLKYLSECEELEKKKLIRCSRNREHDCISFRVPRDVKNSLAKNIAFKPEKNNNLSIYKFFDVLERLFTETENNELNFYSLHTELLELINMNMHLHFCKKIISYDLFAEDLVLLIAFCHLFGNNDDDNIGFHDLELLYDDKIDAKLEKKCLSNGDHTLIEHKLVEFTNNNGFVNSESWKLSDMAKKELLSELKVEKKNYHKNLILHNSIQCKEMFYNEKER